HQGLKQSEIAELVAAPLQKQHRNLDREKMLGARIRRLSRRMQRKAQEGEAAHARQGRCGLRLRGHPPAKGLAAAGEGKFRGKPRGFGHGSADRRMRKFWRVGPLGASFHVRKLIGQRGDAALGEPPGNAVHERVEHSGSRPMREDIAGARARRRRQQPADAVGVIDRNGHGRDIWPVHRSLRPRLGGKRRELRLHFWGRTSHSTLACAGCRVSRCGRRIAMTVKDFEILRRQMLAEIAAGTFHVSDLIGKATLDERVMAAMAKVPRHEFVPVELQPYAYANIPLPIGFEKTISQPFIVALMTDLLDISAEDTVLEIGTGLGYQAAILAQLARKVYTIKIIEDPARQAKQRLRQQGCTNIELKIANGYHGWPDHAPFDKVIVTAAPDLIPPPLIHQL